MAGIEFCRVLRGPVAPVHGDQEGPVQGDPAHHLPQEPLRDLRLELAVVVVVCLGVFPEEGGCILAVAFVLAVLCVVVAPNPG